MPRLTDATYLKQRRALVDDWIEGGGTFALVTPMEQLTLHEYYCPAEHLTDHEALAHRRHAGHETPSLPQRAGKAYTNRLKVLAINIAQTELAWQRKRRAPVRKKYQRDERGEVRVRATMRPQPNYDLLAKALLEHARDETEKTTPTDQDADAT